MVEEQLGGFKLSERKQIINEEMVQTLTLASIPDIPISEIGWSKLDTRDGVQVPSEQRTQLEQFLSNIVGANISEKLASLNKFYSMDDDFITGQLQGANATANISKAISYLVFYKTLTQIITHFNASSAGFSFESFLGVLLGGSQVPTGEGTIADLLDADGNPISLKLYKEGNLEAGGSYTDLAVDLGKEQFNNQMQYICVTKDLSGKDFEQEGVLRFFLFQFDLENVFNILSKSSAKSQKNILLPKPFLDSGGEQVEGLPTKAAALPTPEEMEAEFAEILTGMYDDNIEALEAQTTDASLDNVIQALDFANNDSLFVGNKVRGKDDFGKRGLAQAIARFHQTKMKASESVLYQTILSAYEVLLGRYAKTEQERRRQETINTLYFYGGVDDSERIEVSRAFYENASPELKKRCLMVSHGYVTTGHFNLTQTMIQNVAQIAQPTSGNLFPAGQVQVEIGRLEIGASKIQEVLNKISNVLNDNIFDIFNNLKLLTTNIQGFFAGGLRDDNQATTAITAAENIEKKTEEIRPEKD
jgi:hypothetical protein